MAEVDNSEKHDEKAPAPAEENQSKSPTKAETNEALQHLVQGKRHLLVKDVHSAVDSLQESCRLFAEQYGETADQCGEAYFVYGKALLELARLETGVIGEVGGEGESEDDEDEEGEEKEDAEDGEKEQGDGDAPASTNGDSDEKEGKQENGDEKAEVTSEEKKPESDDTEAEKNDVENESDTKENGVETESEAKENGVDSPDECDTEENGKEQNEDDEEAVSNIQLAWEMLELAKLIFERQSKDRESELKLSQVYLKLGEVSIESENYTQSVSDLKQCLKIQQKHLQPDSRLIAETQYQQGIAHSLANEFSDAISAFGSAVSTIQARITSLNEQIEKRGADSGAGNEDDPFYKEEDEIKELKELLPDIEEKIEDMKQMKREAQQKLAEMFQDGAGPSSLSDGPPLSPVKAIMKPQAAAKSSDEPPKQAQSISHLVKRKRPLELTDAPNGDSKKSKQEN